MEVLSGVIKLKEECTSYCSPEQSCLTSLLVYVYKLHDICSIDDSAANTPCYSFTLIHYFTAYKNTQFQDCFIALLPKDMENYVVCLTLAKDLLPPLLRAQSSCCDFFALFRYS